MKTFRLCTMLVSLLLAIAYGAGEQASGGETAKQATSKEMMDAGYKRYRTKSAMVEYELSGARKGTETLYFDQWGMREAKHTSAETSFSGFSRKENSLTVMDGEWIYAIDLDRKTGTKTKNPLLKEITDKHGTKDLGEIGERIMKQTGEKTGTGDVAGKLCDIWEVKNLGTKTWVWNGVPLKVQTKMAGLEMTTTATRVKEGATIPEDKFAVPAGVRITEGPDVKDVLQRMKQRQK